jgi:hypothetical protein
VRGRGTLPAGGIFLSVAGQARSFQEAHFFLQCTRQKFLPIELGGGVPLRYDRAKQPPVGKPCQQGKGEQIPGRRHINLCTSPRLAISSATVHLSRLLVAEVVAELHFPNLRSFRTTTSVFYWNQGTQQKDQKRVYCVVFYENKPQASLFPFGGLSGTA